MSDRMRCPAVVAAMLATLLAAGCSAQAVATRAGAASAGASPGGAAKVMPECQADDLGVTFIGGEPGAGNDLATIVAWDTASAACRLAGPVTLVGLGSAGGADTNAVRLSAVGAAELTAHGTAPDAGHLLPSGESAAWLVISAEYRDDPTTGGMCTRHQVEPAAFRLTLPAGGTVTVSNAVAHHLAVRGLPANGGLLTCRGELNTASGLTGIAIGNAL